MSYTYLILETSATVRAIVKRLVRLADPSPKVIYEAANGREALDVLARHHVDLILADPRVAGSDDPDDDRVDGAEMIGRILSEPDTRHIPILLMTSNPNARHLTVLRRAGAKGYLRKPFTVNALKDAIVRILEPTHV